MYGARHATAHRKSHCHIHFRAGAHRRADAGPDRNRDAQRHGLANTHTDDDDLVQSDADGHVQSNADDDGLVQSDADAECDDCNPNAHTHRHGLANPDADPHTDPDPHANTGHGRPGQPCPDPLGRRARVLGQVPGRREAQQLESVPHQRLLRQT
ncbi:hypothetical protein GCM10010523_12910 [Paenarthrobacter ilicis]